MNSFIKLTANADFNCTYIWVNKNHIVRFEDYYDKHTKLHFDDGSSIWVVESVEEVMEKLGA